MDRVENRLFEAFQKRIDDDLCDTGKSNKEKFHAVNDDFASKVGFQPFKDYQAYRNAKSRNYRKNKRG